MAKVNLDIAQRLDITCRKGDSFNLALDFGVDMGSGGTWSMHVLETDESVENSVVDFTLTIGENDDGVTNAKLEITADATEMASVESGLYVYDIQFASSSSPSVVTTYLYGLFKINEDITD